MAIRRSDLEQTPLDPVTVGSLKQNSILLKDLYQEIHYGGGALRDIPMMAKRVVKEKLWKRFLLGIEIVEFDSFEDFVVTKPPYGLGATIDQLKALCEKDREAIDLIDQEITRKPGNPTGSNQYESKESGNTDNISNSSKRNESHGTSIEYTLRRLRKDHPELHEKVLANEMSTHAAAIEAGFRKKTVTVAVDVEAIARKLKRLLTPEERQQIMAIWGRE